jgi:hypothetical protein
MLRSNSPQITPGKLSKNSLKFYENSGIEVKEQVDLEDISGDDEEEHKEGEKKKAVYKNYLTKSLID